MSKRCSPTGFSDTDPVKSAFAASRIARRICSRDSSGCLAWNCLYLAVLFIYSNFQIQRTSEVKIAWLAALPTRQFQTFISQALLKYRVLIDLVTVFDAMLTSRQKREKLLWLYENLKCRIISVERLFWKNMICPFYGNYSTLDSHTNTAISHTFAYSSRWRRKPWQGLLRFAFSLNSVTASLQLRFNLSKLFSLNRWGWFVHNDIKSYC